MNTPSPRTFAAVEEYRKYGGSPRNEPVFSSDMFALEDELTAVTEQRDRLAEALEGVLKHFRQIAGDCDIEDQRNEEIKDLDYAEQALQSLNQPEQRRMGRRTINGRRSMKTYKTPRTDYNEFHLDSDGGCVGSWFARDLEEENMQMLEILKTLSQYPLARGHVDGPCIHREDMEEINELIRIVDAKTKKNYH